REKQEQAEQHLGDARGAGGDATEAERARNERDDGKDDRVLQHGTTPWMQRALQRERSLGKPPLPIHSRCARAPVGQKREAVEAASIVVGAMPAPFIHWGLRMKLYHSP